MKKQLRLWNLGRKRQVVYNLFKVGSRAIAEFAIVLSNIHPAELREYHDLIDKYDEITREHMKRGRLALCAE